MENGTSCLGQYSCLVKLNHLDYWLVEEDFRVLRFFRDEMVYVEYCLKLRKNEI